METQIYLVALPCHFWLYLTRLLATKDTCYVKTAARVLATEVTCTEEVRANEQEEEEEKS